MKKRVWTVILAIAMISSMIVSANAADYSFETDGTPEYYPDTSYEDVYGSQYNYGGPNLVDYQIPELEYGSFSTTQTGIMEKVRLPGLQAQVTTNTVPGEYGIGSGESSLYPGVSVGGDAAQTSWPAFTELTDDFLLSNGAVGSISIPAINIDSYYVWEGETTASMKKGVGHFTDTSVWAGNVAVCGHNRGAAYTIGKIKDLEPGDVITYTTSQGKRTYEVETVTKISSTDWSYIEPSTDNRITLITCVANESVSRWCVQAVERS